MMWGAVIVMIPFESAGDQGAAVGRCRRGVRRLAAIPAVPNGHQSP
jgi:hypothetical protein